MHVYTCIYTWTPEEEEEEDKDKEEAFEEKEEALKEEGSCAWMFTLVCADMAAILFKALVGLEAEEEDACTLFLRRQPNTRAHSSLLGRECPAVVLPDRALCPHRPSVLF